MTNAIRHGGAAGPDDRIRLRVLRDGGRVRIEVCDDGPGFAPPSPDDAPPAEGGIGRAEALRAGERRERGTVLLTRLVELG